MPSLPFARISSVLAMLASAFAPWCATASPTYQATVTRTTMGIPHIRANDLGSVGYGYGYAFAEDNLCEFLRDRVTVRGQRSLFFGPDGRVEIPAVPVTASNLDSDFFFKLMATPDAIARQRTGSKPEVQAMVNGYAAGINRYLTELKAGQHPGRHASCATAGYLDPVVPNDIWARIYRLAIIASTSVFITEIANAAPPALSGAAVTNILNATQLGRLLKDNPGPLSAFSSEKPLGSNGYALGPGATADGSNMLFGNPHFPFTGPERFYMAHLTVPGQMDVEGASLFGVPLVLIGFNERLAWSHTVATSYHFSIYQLLLNPLNPLEYVYDGQIRSMTPVPLTVQVKTPSGIETRSRTLYRSQFGPIFTLNVMGLPVLGWDAVRAYTIRDANEVNNRLLNTFFEFGTAQSVPEFAADQARELGVPWVNTLATGPGASAYYADVSVVPHVTNQLADRCAAPVVQQIIATAAPGLPVLQGQRSDCAWGSDAGAPEGIFGPQHLPVLNRSDYVANSNDSHWLSNPDQPLTGFDRIIGPERTPRTLRTRLAIKQIQRRIDGSDGLGGTGFTLEKLKAITLNSKIFSAELARQSVLDQTCFSLLGLPTTITPACDALRSWNGSAELDDRGEPLWREFWNLASAQPGIWLTPFNANDPVNTPNTFFGLNPLVRKSLFDAQQLLADNAIPLNARLRDIQFSAAQPAQSIPVFGSLGSVGAFTVAQSPALEPGGYKVDYGNSYIQAVTWSNGKVIADGFLTYSQSTDPASPHYSDFSTRYAAKNWLRFAFTPSEIASSQISTKVLNGD